MCVLMFHSITFNRVMKIKSHVALFFGKFMRAISTGNGSFQAWSNKKLRNSLIIYKEFLKYCSICIYYNFILTIYL